MLLNLITSIHKFLAKYARYVKVTLLSSILFLNGCQTIQNNSDEVSIYILIKRLERLENKVMELDKLDKTNLKIQNIRPDINQLQKDISIIKNKTIQNIETIITEIQNDIDVIKKETTQDKKIINDTETYIVWITLKNKSKKAIYIKKEEDRYIGPSGEIYEQIPSDKQLEMLYRNK